MWRLNGRIRSERIIFTTKGVEIYYLFKNSLIVQFISVRTVLISPNSLATSLIELMTRRFFASTLKSDHFFFISATVRGCEVQHLRRLQPFATQVPFWH